MSHLAGLPMRHLSNRTLLLVLVVLAAWWLWLRRSSGGTAQLPWNVGQAGINAAGGLYGGGQ